MARGLGYAAQVRRDILRNRQKVQGSTVPVPKPVRAPGLTLAMYLLEQQHGKSIEELIGKGSIKALEKALGVHKTTISKWRKRLGLRE